MRLPPHAPGSAVPLSSRGTPGCSMHHSGSSQLFSPTAYVPSPKASMPMPLLAALPLSSQLVLAPLALLGSPAALNQHPARRVVLLFGPGVGCEAAYHSKAHRAAEAAAAAGGGGLSPASPGSASSASSSWDSSLTGSRRYYGGGGSPAPDYMVSANPMFSPAGTASPSTVAAPSTVGAQRHSARTLNLGTPRAALRFGSTAVHPEPQSSPAAAPSPIAAAAAAGGSAGPRQGGSNRVHPVSPTPPPQQALGLQLVLPQRAAATPGSAHSHPGRSSGGCSAEDALLLRVLSDAELSAAARSCVAAGVECRMALARPAGGERGLQQPLALAQWLAGVALPLLNGGASTAQPVLLAVQAGCEAEAAMAAVAHHMQQRQASLYQAMVAASQWGIDLHLRQHHLLALQHFGASSDSSPAGGSSWRGSGA